MAVELLMNTLAQTLDALSSPVDLPQLLPPVHMSIAKWFPSIAGKGRLEPRKCSIFNKELLYLFYGGIFHRPTNKPTRSAVELPVAFVFDPRVLFSIFRYYPFDTGALASERFGEEWSDKLTPFKRQFGVLSKGDPTVPSKMVYHLYGNNEKYLAGRVDRKCESKPDPLPLLYQFFRSDLSSKGVDHRQCVIECQTTAPIVFEKWLLWVAFPDIMTNVFAKLLAWMKPSIPQSYEYRCHVIRNPAEVAAHLQYVARQQVIDQFVTPPRGK